MIRLGQKIHRFNRLVTVDILVYYSNSRICTLKSFKLVSIPSKNVHNFCSRGMLSGMINTSNDMPSIMVMKDVSQWNNKFIKELKEVILLVERSIKSNTGCFN